jgi:hypothetical protein
MSVEAGPGQSSSPNTRPGVEYGPHDPYGTPASRTTLVAVEGANGAFNVPGLPNATHESPASPDAARRDGAATKAPEVTKAEAKDIADRYTDAELLGKSFRVRRTVYEAGTQRVKVWQGMKAKIANVKDMPAKAVKKFAHVMAQRGLARRERRLQKAKDAGASERLIERRQSAVNTAEQKANKREKDLHWHSAVMEDRTKTVDIKVRNMREEYTTALKERKHDAVARKAVRKQLRTEGATWRERRALAAEIPRSHLDRVGDAALKAETSKRSQSEAKRLEKWTERQLGHTHRSIRNTEKSIDRHNAKAKDATDRIAEINGVEDAETVEGKEGTLSMAEAHLSDLRDKLRGMKAGDPDFVSVSAQKVAAQRKVEELEAARAHWHYVAAAHVGAAMAGHDRIGVLNVEQSDRKELKEAAGDNTAQKGAVHGHLKQTLEETVTVALRSKK